MTKNTKSFYLVVGLGKTGLSIARYLERKKESFYVYDTRKSPDLLEDFQKEFPHIAIYLEAFPEDLYNNLSAIVSSPGVSLDIPLVQHAKERNIPVYGDIECFAQEVRANVVAITGTNGKSTVTTLVGEMAAEAGIHVAVAGNIGTPVLDRLRDEPPYDLWVLELSSFQLDLTYSLAPIASTILNVTNDHLDRHHSLEAYIAAKQRVYHSASMMLYNRADSATRPFESTVNSTTSIVSYGLDEPEQGHWGIRTSNGKKALAFGSTLVIAVDELKIKGLHNWENALSACALAHAAGIGIEPMRRVLQRFSGLPHRAQWVRTLNGVNWINDSKGTNIGATCSAISGIGDSMKGKLVLIAGGQGKGADFSELQKPVEEHVRLLVLIGQDADLMENALGSVVKTVRAATLEEAVQCANQQAQPGDVVLLSPACASLDMFRDFNDRGQKFITAVNAL